ncbi:5-methyltetrahydropteroyltriglutamate--homocysteine S-methyltransferase [Spelaeicoccus albus]|uniref:5-methyltetrahydropteroyltriglutamate--homocysteine methyltransferase n=1 Tax=Spelaeicoccus albus TaxID=1280376 RepID=A0A7Z0CYZ6_9MICO|nr:5-methyltetrahydropteroyltriglutamate--homocysteine S-methyltransferase [Spelaeicoccus albus]NYI65754.1 5-methyltetrahydropteroyltriglutamate--homocysteine methyltransferase [Spelaeicoccus albus]
MTNTTTSTTTATDPGTKQFPSGTILGYPRIGPRRELKKALESYWSGRTDAEQLRSAAADLRRSTADRLTRLGLDPVSGAIPGGFSLYDQVLDAAVTLGAVPERLSGVRGPDGGIDLDGYFSLARGNADTAPLEMTKWFDTNYHYLVPELSPDTDIRLGSTAIVDQFREATADGVTTRPVIVGPVTFLLLSKAADDAPSGFRPLDRLGDVVAAYRRLLARLAEAGAEWVQLDEPGLVVDGPNSTAALGAARTAYAELGAAPIGAERPAIFASLQYADAGDAFAVLARTPVEAIGIDLVRGDVPDLTSDVVSGLAGKTVVAGLVDGHNVWRTDLARAAGVLERLAGLVPSVSVSTSTSLFHVPHTLDDEPSLPAALKSWLRFADEKVAEVAVLARGLRDGFDTVRSEIEEATEAGASRERATGVRDGVVRGRLAGLAAGDFERGDYARRRLQQDRRLGLSPLPTTTIGSFPQTAEVRAARGKLRTGELSADEYRDAMRAEIARVVELQHDLGLDVIVHGEPERSDMVQYFAENLDGFATTANGWVQSYGSRCTRPSILWGDVSRPAPMTVPWASYAASLTEKPLKGMLTGPVTILAWSFVRDDQPLGDTARQVALALRDEVADLESAGIPIIQVDEPALRELLPLKAADRPAYLDWSVGAFRLATSGVADATSIHTHLCYSEFGEVIGAIDDLNADVTSIEAARSRMEVLSDLRAEGFSRGIGPGVYDIHSPRVPTTEEITGLIRAALESAPADRLWVNPDCGLKTRGYAETRAALENLVGAAHAVRRTRAAVGA